MKLGQYRYASVNMGTKFCVFVSFLAIYTAVDAQLSRGTILNVLTQPSYKLSKFGEWCQQTMEGFYDGTTRMTVFAFNDTTYHTMPSGDRQTLNSMTMEQRREYVMTFTVNNEYRIEQFLDNTVLKSASGRTLFVNKKNRQYWNPGGTTGMTATYINGGMIVGEMIQASNGIIYVLDRALMPVSNKNVYNWISRPDNPSVQTTIFQDLSSRLFSQYYSEAIAPISQRDKITFFLPSENALRKIPQSKLQRLNGRDLANYFQMHFIPDKVVFTSYIEHQESYANGYTGAGNSAAENGRVLFMRQEEKVMVQSGGVTAMIEPGSNITLENGVIHLIDRMFGYVYNSAMEQISEDCPTFSRLVTGGPPDIQTKITQPAGTNVFVPSEEAFQRVQSLPWVNFDQNITLKDYILGLSLVRDGSVQVSQLNGNYDVRQRRISYNNMRLVIYMDRNETWVNGGNVRARIIRPDIKVTTGRLQYIDAVLGIPYMDIPTLIYYDDYLIYPYNDLKMTGLVDYLKDPRYDPSMLPPRTFDSYNGQGLNGYGNNFFPTTMYPGQQTQYPGQQTQYPGQNYPGQNNQQYPGQQYPGQNNQQYPGQQYPGQNNQQYPGQNNQQYPGQNNQQYPGQSNYPGQNNFGQASNSYGTCGDYNNVCQFTFFVPNGTAIYNYYMSSLGQQVTRDVPRYRYILRRLLIPNTVVTLENLIVGPQTYRYRTHTGELISIKKETDNIVRLYWGGVTARVIMWDIGATNGIVHIIDTVLSDLSDLDRDISAASAISCSLPAMSVLLLLCLAFFYKRD